MAPRIRSAAFSPISAPTPRPSGYQQPAHQLAHVRPPPGSVPTPAAKHDPVKGKSAMEAYRLIGPRAESQPVEHARRAEAAHHATEGTVTTRATGVPPRASFWRSRAGTCSETNWGPLRHVLSPPTLHVCQNLITSAVPRPRAARVPLSQSAAAPTARGISSGPDETQQCRAPRLCPASAYVRARDVYRDRSIAAAAGFTNQEARRRRARSAFRLLLQVGPGLKQ